MFYGSYNRVPGAADGAIVRPIAVIFVMLMLLFGGVGCAGVSSPSSESATVPIGAIDAVAGRWRGTVKVPGVFPTSTVRLSIRENGTFRFSNDRLTGIRVGGGRLTQVEGTLISDEHRLHVTFRLHETNGVQILVADGIAPTGEQFHAELTRDE